MSKTKVFLLCSGLGNIRRGFESFTQECFDALKEEEALDVLLFKGAGSCSRREKSIWNLPRSGGASRLFAKMFQSDPYKIEQITFTLSLLPALIAEKPQVVMFSDGSVGNVLWHYRRHSKQVFSLLFSNGGPLGPPFPRWDHIQQVSPEYCDLAARTGVPIEKQSLVPYAFDLPESFSPPGKEEIELSRHQLGLPLNRQIVISIGAINSRHKRMDYVIEEVASLPEPRPFLLLLGETTSETPSINSLAQSRLGRANFDIRTVPAGAVVKCLRVSDVFALGSLQEGFGRVLVEALSQGLACIVHDYRTSRFVLGNFGVYGDLTRTGSLSSLLVEALSRANVASERRNRYAYAYKTFSWAALRPSYIHMIRTAASAFQGLGYQGGGASSGSRIS
jgi:1,2-diacylglycerol 3-alpha-glucosyltransferase